MKLKQLYMVLVISLLLMGVLIGTKEKNLVHEGSLKPGDKIFTDWNEVKTISISRGQQKSEIYKMDGDWVLKNRYDFIADQKQVSDVLGDLKNMKVAQTVDTRTTDKHLYTLDKDSQLITEQPIELNVEFTNGKKTKLYLGKSHSQGTKVAGRYYMTEQGEVFISTQVLSNTQEDPRVWLRKFLPPHQNVLSVSYFSRGRLIWQTGRSTPNKPLKFKYPSELSKMTDRQTHGFMTKIFQARYLDVEVARPVDKRDFEGERLELVDYKGRTYSLELLKREKSGKIRCRLALNTDADLEAASDYMDIQQALSEWHFMLSESLLPYLKLQK